MGVDGLTLNGLTSLVLSAIYNFTHAPLYRLQFLEKAFWKVCCDSDLLSLVLQGFMFLLEKNFTDNILI